MAWPEESAPKAFSAAIVALAAEGEGLDSSRQSPERTLVPGRCRQELAAFVESRTDSGGIVFGYGEHWENKWGVFLCQQAPGNPNPLTERPLCEAGSQDQKPPHPQSTLSDDNALTYPRYSHDGVGRSDGRQLIHRRQYLSRGEKR